MTPRRSDVTADLPELLTVAEVAAVLRLSDETIHRWARKGKLPYVDVLGIKRFRREQVLELLGGESPAPLPADPEIRSIPRDDDYGREIAA